jgi:hypothetical protein
VAKVPDVVVVDLPVVEVHKVAADPSVDQKVADAEDLSVVERLVEAIARNPSVTNLAI